jgi:hypothetical protein
MTDKVQIGVEELRGLLAMAKQAGTVERWADLAMEFMQAQAEHMTKLEDALVWCGGSADFAPGGQAREGWEKTVMPLLRKRA